MVVGSREAAERPAAAARAEGADAIVGGRITCSSGTCRLEMAIYDPSGDVLSDATEEVPAEDLVQGAARLAVELLAEAGLLGERVERGEEWEEGEWWEAEERPPAEEEPRVEAEPPDLPDREEPAPEARRFAREEERRGSDDIWAEDPAALELWVTGHLTVVRDLCVDTGTALRDDAACNGARPAYDDRAYSLDPFAGIGGHIVVFPGAFVRTDPWWAHLGVYADYSYGLGLESVRSYQSPRGETIEVVVRTVQHDLRVGIVGRIPIGMGRRFELRALVGYGMYEFAFEDSDYPDDGTLTASYQVSNPYLPSFTYSSLDFGVEARYTFLGLVTPYLSAAYRLGLAAGQAGEVFGTEAWPNGFRGELGLVVGRSRGPRGAIASELIYYGTTYSGTVDWETSPHVAWVGTPPGQWSTDLVVRVRVLAGWAF